MQARFDEKPAVKLALCVPSLGEWKAGMAMAFSQMCVYMAAKLFENDQDRQVVVLEKRSSSLCHSRQSMLQDALMQDCTHALLIDSDQIFPQDTGHRLMAWKSPSSRPISPSKPSPPSRRQGSAARRPSACR